MRTRKNVRRPSLLRAFTRPERVLGAAVLAVSIAMLGLMGLQVQRRVTADAARYLQGGVASPELLLSASDCTKRQLNMNYTRNELVVMVEDVNTLEANCTGLERHQAMVAAQREALADHTANKAVAQNQPAKSNAN